MSNNTLTVEGEYRYVLQWIRELSDMQRDDFIKPLVEYLKRSEGPECSAETTAVGHCNGGPSPTTKKPMSLFECRVKLFNQWCPSWPEEFKQKLRDDLLEIDPVYSERVNNELNCGEIAVDELKDQDLAEMGPTGFAAVITTMPEEVGDANQDSNEVSSSTHSSLSPEQINPEQMAQLVIT